MRRVWVGVRLLGVVTAKQGVLRRAGISRLRGGCRVVEGFLLRLSRVVGILGLCEVFGCRVLSSI